MRAIAITPLKAKTAQIVEIPRPTASAGGALVRIIEIGIDGTDAVLFQLRIGGQAARHVDETFPHECGCIGQETTGAGGLAVASIAKTSLSGSE